MSEDVLVSVCVISYNHEKYIEDCLNSILSQKTNFKFNVFVSDDCSQDATYEIIQRYEKKYDNVFGMSRCGMPKCSVNGRPNGNFNFIDNLKRANGKYIALCDGDDFWAYPDKLQTQVDHLNSNEGLAIVCSQKNTVLGDKILPETGIGFDLIFSYRLLCFYNPINSSSIMFKRSLFQSPSDWFYKLEIGDWPLWFQMAKGMKILKLSKKYLNYRVHNSNAFKGKLKSERALMAYNVVKTLRREFGGGPFLLLSCSLHYCRYRLKLAIEKITRKSGITE